MIEFPCPHCKTMIRVEDRYSGQWGKCTHCGKAVQASGTPANMSFELSAPSNLPPPIPSSDPGGGRRMGLAIASLVFGIGSFMLFGPLFSIPAVICGHIALVRNRRDSRVFGGQGLAIAGLVLGYLNIVLMLLILPAILLPALARAREAARRASCAMNLKQVGLSLTMFSNEDEQRHYPLLSSESGRLMFDGAAVYPEYLPDTTILYCPSDSDSGKQEDAEINSVASIDDHSYFYLGYVLTSDDEVAAFAEVYRRRLGLGFRFDEDLDAPAGAGSGGGGKFLMLREGVEQLMADGGGSPIQSRIPVIIERIDNHVPPGANVIYMDGHVEYIRYPGKWPMTETTMKILESLDAQ